jgi:CHAT domain-containing protein/tetratricopeptide (TPR) repeat protein
MRRGLALVAAVAGFAACATGGPAAGRYGVDDDVLAIVRRGEGAEALAAYQAQAAELDRPERAPGLAAGRIHAAAAQVAELLGHYDRGLRHARRAIALLEPAAATSLPALLALTQSHLALGNVQLQLNVLADAEREFDRVLELAAGLPPPAGLAAATLARINLASVFALRGEAERAIATGRPAIADAERLLARSVSLSVGAGGIPQAIQQARDLVAAELGRALLTVGRAELERGQAAEAAADFRRALDYARAAGATQHAALARFFLAEATATPGRAPGEGEVALQDARQAGLSAVVTVMLAHRGARAAAAGRAREALEAYAGAIAEVETVRGQLEGSALRGLFVENKQDLYQGAVRAALELGQVGEAFGYAERARARAFLDLLGTQTLLSRDRDPAGADEERRLRARIAAARPGPALEGAPGAPAGRRDHGRRAREVAVGAYDAFVTRLRTEQPEQASLMSVDPVGLAEVQRLLPEDTTLLEYLVGASETVLWAVRRDGVRVHRLPVGRAALVEDVGRLRAAVAAQEEIAPLAARAWQRLVAPAREDIAGARVLVVPHDVLHYLPWAALRAGERWLVEEAPLLTLPSASVLRYLEGKGQGAARPALVIGNPELGPGLALPWAEREAAAVGERYPGAVVLLRGAATEARIKALAGEAAVLHFASHGELRADDPLASALLLAPEGDEDGRLEVREIFRLSLRARLAVLSACDTGLGGLSRGDELVGLQRAFLYAGAAAVVTTLWKVDDRATFELMREFHARLAEGRRAPEALREAQVAMLRRSPHPLFWGAFVLTGGPR